VYCNRPIFHERVKPTLLQESGPNPVSRTLTGLVRAAHAEDPQEKPGGFGNDLTYFNQMGHEDISSRMAKLG